jgi:hypothetical protein
MLLDIGIGIISAIFLDKFFSVPLTLAFLGCGILFALLPDLDFLFSLKKGFREKAHEHRNLFHYPLLIVPIGTAIMAFFDHPLALLFAITTLAHFIHDSIGVGWGVQWLYPFSRKHYAFFYHYDTSRNHLPYKLLYAWSPDEVGELSTRYGDKDWMKNIYGKFHPYAIVELAVFLLALVILLVVR